MTDTNPLLREFDLPPYSEIRPEHVEPAVDTVLGENRVALQELLSRPAESLDWGTLVVGLDEMNERLSRAWGPVSHLNAVRNNAELRSAYEACLPKLSAYATELGQNADLFAAYQALSLSAEADGFDEALRCPNRGQVACAASHCVAWRYVLDTAAPHGLIVEVHPRPEDALSDGPQSLKPKRFQQLMRELDVLRRALIEVGAFSDDIRE